MPASSAGKAMLATILFLSTMLFVDSSREILREETDPLQLVLSKYLNNDELEDHLHDFVERCSSISQLVSIGKSVNGRWVGCIQHIPVGDIMLILTTLVSWLQGIVCFRNI